MPAKIVENEGTEREHSNYGDVIRTVQCFHVDLFLIPVQLWSHSNAFPWDMKVQLQSQTRRLRGSDIWSTSHLRNSRIALWNCISQHIKCTVGDILPSIFRWYIVSLKTCSKIHQVRLHDAHCGKQVTWFIRVRKIILKNPRDAHVSRHTPTLVLFSTWSIMLFSSGNWEPITFPEPAWVERWSRMVDIVLC